MSAYNDALTSVFLMLLPMVTAGFLVLLINEVPLRGSLDKDPRSADDEADASADAVESPVGGAR